MKQPTSERSSGILLHITSLPGPYGIGDLGRGAHEFVNFLEAAGQSWWQILPLGPTSPVFGNSPYMSGSALAGNPLLISPELLLEQGLISPSELETSGFSEYLVDFGQVIPWKEKLLDSAFQRFMAGGGEKKLDEFADRTPWVRDHALFLALKERFRQKPWHRWPEGLRRRKSGPLHSAARELRRRVRRHIFAQYIFFGQWRKLRRHAQDRGVAIIGDLPIYVAHDSVDTWANQEIFALDAASSRPTHVAGVPPDYFSKTGQLWGNPLYRWNSGSRKVEQHLMAWWETRLQTLFSLVDAVRIDHFRGFASYWSVPAGEVTAVNGTWRQGPGITFFREMEQRLGRLAVIAEDLGIITPEVERLRDELEFPGMKILLFGFDGSPANSHLPHTYGQNCVVYTGTHDNDTAVGWFLSPEVPREAKVQAKRYANRDDMEVDTFHRDLLYLAFSSTARLAILPMQDLLGFGNDCRMNRPGTTRGNWQWRCAPRFITRELADWLREKTVFFGRLPETGTSEDGKGRKQ